MNAEVEAYLRRIETIHGEAKKLIQGMAAKQLGWAPLAKDTNAPYAIVTHMAGSEAYWVHQVIGGVDVHRNREAEFAAKGPDIATLVALLDMTGQTTRQVLQRVGSGDLEQPATLPPGREPMTRRDAALHIIVHLSEHLGHLGLTKQLYEARQRA